MSDEQRKHVVAFTDNLAAGDPMGWWSDDGENWTPYLWSDGAGMMTSKPPAGFIQYDFPDPGVTVKSVRIGPADELAALAAKDARIAELEAETELRWRQYQALGAETHARIAELEEALRPFAEAGVLHYTEAWADDNALAVVDAEPIKGEPAQLAELTVGDFRRARAVLEKG